MKQFHYNVLVDREDFADRDQDIKQLLESIQKGRKTVLYAPRRYGKTSLAQNILPNEFKRKDRAHLYVDFMDCADLDSIAQRLLESYALTLKTYFKKDHLIEATKGFLKTLSLGFTPDALTGEFSLDLTTRKVSPSSLAEILTSLVGLCQERKTLLIFDEFQDIHSIPQSTAIFRSHLQKLKSTPMLFLGSKRKLLAEIFSSNQSPFFNFADEHVLQPIELSDWIPFFADRLKTVKTFISNEALEYLCQEALQVPNSICEMGAYIQDFHQGQKIDEKAMPKILNELIDRKSEFYRYQLSLLSQNEIKICKALSANHFTIAINGKEFLKTTGLAASSATKAIQKLYKTGVIEEESQGYRISNPILGLFLKYRSY